jgi:hypothetical protein
VVKKFIGGASFRERSGVAVNACAVGNNASDNIHDVECWRRLQQHDRDSSMAMQEVVVCHTLVDTDTIMVLQPTDAEWNAER